MARMRAAAAAVAILERGRPMEIDPLVTVVQEMGRITGVPTPILDTVLALVTQRARIAGLH